MACWRHAQVGQSLKLMRRRKALPADPGSPRGGSRRVRPTRPNPEARASRLTAAPRPVAELADNYRRWTASSSIGLRYFRPPAKPTFSTPLTASSFERWVWEEGWDRFPAGTCMAYDPNPGAPNHPGPLLQRSWAWKWRARKHRGTGLGRGTARQAFAGGGPEMNLRGCTSASWVPGLLRRRSELGCRRLRRPAYGLG